MKTIVLTGGGTAGHVMPCVALIPKLISNGYSIKYIGSVKGMERGLIEKENIPYYAISSGKLRRYIDFKNLTDAFRVVKGAYDAFKVLKNIKPNVVFSKGGFVAVPVCVAARMLNIPVIIHESDISMGLANKLCTPFADKICGAFPETLKNTPKKKAVLTGTPVREQVLNGERGAGLKFCGFNGLKPVLLIIGGSLGSVRINDMIKQALGLILPLFDIIHITGRGNIDDSIKTPGYRQFEFITNELPCIFAAADCIISRAGANIIAEILTLKKPALLIPLSRSASRGDQILNAMSFAARGFGCVLYEEEYTAQTLQSCLNELYKNAGGYINKMNQNPQADGVAGVMGVIAQVV